MVWLLFWSSLFCRIVLLVEFAVFQLIAGILILISSVEFPLILCCVLWLIVGITLMIWIFLLILVLVAMMWILTVSLTVSTWIPYPMCSYLIGTVQLLQLFLLFLALQLPIGR